MFDRHLVDSLSLHIASLTDTPHMAGPRSTSDIDMGAARRAMQKQIARPARPPLQNINSLREYYVSAALIMCCYQCCFAFVLKSSLLCWFIWVVKVLL